MHQQDNAIQYSIRKEKARFSPFNSDAEIDLPNSYLEVDQRVDHFNTFDFEYGEITNREIHDHESVCNDNNTVNFSEEGEQDFDTPWTASICNEGDVYVNTNHSDDNSGNSDENCEVTGNRIGYLGRKDERYNSYK